MKTSLADVGHPLRWETAIALVGGPALYLLAHVAFKRRALGTLSSQRLIAVAALVACVPIAHRFAALTVVGAVGTILWSTLVFELVRFASTRRDVRNGALRTD